MPSEPFKNLEIAYSPLTETIYIAQRSKDGKGWTERKKDATNSFMQAVLAKFGPEESQYGAETNITIGGKEKFKITITRIK